MVKPHRFKWEAVATKWRLNLNKGDFPRLTYWPTSWKSLSADGLWDLAKNTLGCSLFYMGFLHVPWDLAQRQRVAKLCERLAKDGWPKRFPDTEDNRAWFHKLLIEICEEVENQC